MIAARNDSREVGDSVSFRLSAPVAGDFGEISELTFRRPTEHDLLEIPHDPLEMHPPAPEDGPRCIYVLRLNPRIVAAWLERLSGVPLELLRELRLRDAAACWKLVEPMLKAAARRELMN